MKIILPIIKTLIIIIIVVDRYRIYNNDTFNIHILNIAFNANFLDWVIYFYDSIICISTFIGVFLYYPIASIGILIDSLLKIYSISRIGLNKYREIYDDRSEEMILAVILIVVIQILIYFYNLTKRQSNFKNVNEDRKRSPKHSKDSNNPSKRRKQIPII